VPQEFVHASEGGESPDWGSACAVRNAWHAAATASQHVLDSITVEELVEQQVLIRRHRQEQPPATMGISGAAQTLLTTD
jgi:DNA-binding IscR family transcriptional regulator